MNNGNKTIIRDRNGFRVARINRRKAIRYFCAECVGWETYQIDRCNGEHLDGSMCSFHSFRSGQGKQNAKLRSKVIRDYCLWCMVGNKAEVSKCTSPDCSLFPYRKSAIDRSAEIKSIPKSSNIEPVSGNKTENEYQSADIT